MRKLRLRKSMKAAWITAAMTLAGSSLAFGAAQALPNGTIVNVGGVNYLTDPQGERYSGWFIDAGENWYYFNESDKAMKTGWHHDSEDGYWYYLNPADGKMADGWQTIDGKEYFFQPVRNMGNYFFNSEQEKWLYSLNSNVPYGAMYRSTVTPDGSTVDETGAKVTGGSQAAAVQNGWVTQNGKKYYFENGIMVSGGWKTIGGKSYYFGGDGTLYVNTTTPDGVKVDGNGVKVTGSSQAAAVQNGWVTQNGKKYYFENGIMVSGGWKTIGGKSYYFGGDGTLYVNTTTPDGVKVDGNGAKVSTSAALKNSKVKKLIMLLEEVHEALVYYDYPEDYTDREGQRHVSENNYNVLCEELTAQEQAYVLARYITEHDDSRVRREGSDYGFLKLETGALAREIFGDGIEEGLNAAFMGFKYIVRADTGTEYLYVSFPIGVYPEIGYDLNDVEDVSMENGRLKITGKAKCIFAGDIFYKNYTGYFKPGSGTALYNYHFDQLIVY